MDSVVQVVKTCYLASSAIARIEGTVPVSPVSQYPTFPLIHVPSM